jgi:hypothetical protein
MLDLCRAVRGFGAPLASERARVEVTTDTSLSNMFLTKY